MRGGAQSHLLEADDGQFYVVKFLNNPQHRRILVNELIASSFFRYLQIAVPETAIISVSEEFLAENPEACLQLGAAAFPSPRAGTSGPVSPAIPRAWRFTISFPTRCSQQVTNLAHFLGALVLDKWMANADARQAIYFRARIGEWAASGGGKTRQHQASSPA